MIIYQNLMTQEKLEVRIKTILRRFNHSNIQEETNIKKTFILDEEKKDITKNGISILN
jgi:two-component system OmpR family response regulator